MTHIVTEKRERESRREAEIEGCRRERGPGGAMETRSPGKRGSVTTTEFGREAGNTGGSSLQRQRLMEGQSPPSVRQRSGARAGGPKARAGTGGAGGLSEEETQRCSIARGAQIGIPAPSIPL